MLFLRNSSTTTYCGAAIDTKISTDHLVSIFDRFVKRAWNYFFHLLNLWQLNESRAAERFSSARVGQLDVHKENKRVSAGHLFSCPPRHLVCMGYKPKARWFLRDVKERKSHNDKKNGFSAHGFDAGYRYLCCAGNGCSGRWGHWATYPMDPLLLRRIRRYRIMDKVRIRI